MQRIRPYSPQFLIIWGAMFVHLVQAGILLWFPGANGAIDISAILAWISLEHAPAVLISISGLALMGLLDIELSWQLRLGCLLPQQALITLSVMGVFDAVLRGSYADGTVKPGMHILTDQLWLVAYFFIHIYSVAKRTSS